MRRLRKEEKGQKGGHVINEYSVVNTGKIVQVMGPVVDVVFENGDLPCIKDALEVTCEGKNLVWRLHST